MNYEDLGFSSSDEVEELLRGSLDFPLPTISALVPHLQSRRLAEVVKYVWTVLLVHIFRR